jgi:heme/copper-type cytochrome/quinol oxidase subunit 2
VARLLIVAATVVVAVGLFMLVRPDAEDEQPLTTPTTVTGTRMTTSPPAPPQPPPPARIEITVRGGTPVDGVRRITVAKGRRVVLIVTSDVADHVHVHGYDLMRDVAPGRPARIPFPATIVGTVEVELEDRGVPLATVTTKP